MSADRTVEHQHHFPGVGEFRLHFLDDLGGIGRGKPIEEDEEVDGGIDDHKRDGGAQSGGKARAEALRLRALEQLVEDEEIGRAHSELQSLMRISYAVFCLKKKTKTR